MHPINRLLGVAGLTLGTVRKSKRIPVEYLRQYAENLEELKRAAGEFEVIREIYYEAGAHPKSYADFECEFAAKQLSRERAEAVLDIGSYRGFLIGLLAGQRLTTIDVRPQVSPLANERACAADARQLPFLADSFDAVVSLCALEHVGLTRYGDEFDPRGDRRALEEMWRVLRPGGRLILSTTIRRGRPVIAFNAHRIYTYDLLQGMLGRFHREEEAAYSFSLGRLCSLREVTKEPRMLDVYMGLWRKDV